MARFCNPLVLLHLENILLVDLTPERIRAAELRLLTELEINGQQTVPYHGHPLPETTVLAAIELLEKPAYLQFFQRLVQEPDLHNFLHGSWSVSFGAMTNSSLWHHPILRDPLKVYMQPALAIALVQALQLRQQRRVLEIVTLVEATPILEATVCYAPAQTWLEAQVTMLNTLVLDKETPDYPQKSRAVRKDLLDGKAYEARTLNSLPEYVFRPRIGELGLCLTDLARRAFPAEPYFAVKTFSTARLLDVDQALHAQIESTYTSTAGKWEPPIEEAEPVQAPPPPRQKPAPPKPKPAPRPKPKPTLQWQPPLQNPYSPNPNTPPYTPAPVAVNWNLVGRIGFFLIIIIMRAATCSDWNKPKYQESDYYSYLKDIEAVEPSTRRGVAAGDKVIANLPKDQIIEINTPMARKIARITSTAQDVANPTLRRPFEDCLPVRASPDNAHYIFSVYGDTDWDAVVFLYAGNAVYDHFYLPKGKMTRMTYRANANVTGFVVFGKDWSEDLKSPCGTKGYFRRVGRSYQTRAGSIQDVLYAGEDRYYILLDPVGGGKWIPLSDQEIFQKIVK